MTRSKLISIIRARKSYLCVGLDPEISKLPKHLLELEDPIFEFNKQIIDATRDLCVAYKPNTAFYEALGLKGWAALEKTIQYIGSEHFIIADAKRGDIGNTSKMYATCFFEQLGADAVTVAPYMGEDSVKPFLDFDNKWAIVLGLTSNKGSQDFQLQQFADETLLYENVIKTVQNWGTTENLMFVIGATHPDKLVHIRKLAPHHFFLVPGVGAQGGDLTEVSKAGINSDCGLLINASRSILYASNGIDFAAAARHEAQNMQTIMQQFIK
jgi:orotidine-5'-phosphate decarboxylase